jgi:hypothetical protein
VVVFEQFLEAGPCHVHEFDFRFLGRTGSLAAFEDVLFPRARGLHHLVDRAVAATQEELAEPVREIVDNLGLLEAE